MKAKSLFKPLQKFWPGLLYIILFFLLSPIMELLNRPIGTVRNLHSWIDDLIPFRPEFILTYHSWMPSLLMLGFAFYLLALRKNPQISEFRELSDTKEYTFYRDYALSLILGQGLAHLTFPFFQTTIPRYPFTNPPQGFFEALVYKTYQVDNHYCGFPSIHVLTSLIAIFFVLKSDFKLWIKVLIALHFALIIASTMLVKQHVFWDFPGAFIYSFVGIAALPLSRKLGDAIERRYQR